MIIYKITNIISNKIYIGQTTKSLHVRWMGHCRSTGCRRLFNSIIKHGKENFVIEEIDRAENIEDLNIKEEYWIKFYNSTNLKIGYNLKSGGKNSQMAEETKKLIGDSKRGKKRSDELKNKLSHYHKNLPKEIQEKFTKCNIGRKKPCSEERRKKLSIAKTSKPRPEYMKVKISEKLKANARLNPMQGISKNRQTYKIQIQGKYLGCVKTIEEAKIIRDQYLKELDNQNKSEV